MKRLGIRRGFHASSLTLSVKVLLLLVFVIVTNYGAWNRVGRLSSALSVLVFLALWAVSVAALFFIAFMPQRLSRYLWTAVLAVSSTATLSYSLITRDYLRLADVEQLLEVLAFAGNVLSFYAAQLLTAALVGAIGIAALNLPPFGPAVSGPGARRLAAVLLPWVPIAGIMGVLLRFGGEGADGLPAQFTSPAFVAVLGLERMLSGRQPRRKEVAIAPADGPRPRNVIVIMDESVRGDLFDLNRPGGTHSGLLAHRAEMVNFGIMSSIANCSAQSNAGFRYGVGRHSPMADLKTNPSIWQYAKNAAYRTVYLDGQRFGGHLHNLMTEEERAQIDEHIQLPSATPPRERDMEIARRVRRIIQDSRQPTFVYVNKMGAHFPYEGKYPPERAALRPVLKNTLGDLPQSADSATRAAFRNSYLNTVAWNVGHFFDTLLADLDLSNTVIVYMSDHGQNLHEDGSPGYATHCTTAHTSPMEGIVPLVVLTQVPEVLARMREAAGKNHDRVSQFNVFPSVLALLGYRPEDIARSASSESPLEADLPTGQQQFASVFFVRFGRQPVWNSIRARIETAARDGSSVSAGTRSRLSR
jgi:glucan phosphoethanolaminetransferase (alkaline phosphatase superfamily)